MTAVCVCMRMTETEDDTSSTYLNIHVFESFIVAID